METSTQPVGHDEQRTGDDLGPAATSPDETAAILPPPRPGGDGAAADTAGQGPAGSGPVGDAYVVDLSAGGSWVVVSHDGGGRLGYVVLDEEGTPLLTESRLDRPVVTGVGRPSGVSDVWLREAEKTAVSVSQISRDLLTRTTADSRVTAERMSTAFTSFRAMLWVTFGVGVGAFAAAVVKGFVSSTATTTADVVTTAVFGGLSATALVAAFISRPSTTMGEAGLRAAWAQTIVTTYWSKLAYMSDPVKVLEQLEQTQCELNRSMREYFQAATAPMDGGASAASPIAGPTTPPAASSEGEASSTGSTGRRP